MAAFVGRTVELEALGDALRPSAQPGAALVTGVAGSGKSRLLSEARKALPRHRAFAIVGFESEAHVPLAAAAGLLRGLSLVPGHGEVLDALVFPGVDRRVEFGASDAGPFEPLRIFEAAHRALGAGGRTLLVIDDLQWIDDMSMALCHYLVRAAVESQQRIGFMAATRPGGPGQELFETLPEGSVRRIELGPLGEEEGTALARALDPQLDAESARGVWRQAKGNAFWLEALARYGISGGGLDQILARRLRGAGRDAGTLLGALSLAGRPLPIGVAAMVLDQQVEAVETALGVLVERGLAHLEPDGARPAHDLIRTVAIAQLSPDARARIHRGLADRFEHDAGTDIQTLRLALGHRRAAGLPVMALARRLAALPQRRLLGKDGIRDLGAVADEADPTDPDAAGLHADVAALAYELGEHADALARWSLAAERADDRSMAAGMTLRASWAAHALGRTDEARDLLERSRELVSADPLLALEQTTQEAAIGLWLDEHGAEGRELARRASSMARRLAKAGGGGGPRGRDVVHAVVDALRVEYEAALQRGDPESLLRVAEQREAEARRAGLEQRLEAGLALGVAYRQNGRARQSVARFRVVWAEADRAVLPVLAVDAGFWLAHTLVSLGELGEAEEILNSTKELVARVGDVARGRHGIARLDADLQLERGRVAGGLTLVEHEISHAPSDHERLALHADRALWAARLDGDTAADTIQHQLNAAERCVASVGCPRCTGEMLLLSAETLGRIGRRDEARRALERRDALTFPLMDLDRLMYGHAEALAAGPPEDRVPALDAALRAAEALPYGLRTLWIRLDLARSLAAAKDERALAELERTVAEAESRGATTVRQLAERSLRALGVRTWRRGVAGAPLTRREEEVAHLVAAGATNREVAATLFVSAKTVERHLVNLFRKLDVRNRTELATRLREADTKRTGIPR